MRTSGRILPFEWGNLCQTSNVSYDGGLAYPLPMALTDEAIERIKEMIVNGELRPGDRLPKEIDLAERLGLSRNSLREAVKALSLIRVLDVRQGDGTYVTSLQPEVLLDTVGFVLDFHRDDSVLALLEVRRILEPAATAMAAHHMSDDEIAYLGERISACCSSARRSGAMKVLARAPKPVVTP